MFGDRCLGASVSGSTSIVATAGESNDNPELASVVQHALRRIVEVVELPVSGGLDEQHGEDAAQYQGDRKEKEDGVHVRASFMLASIRDEPQITMALDAGIRMAATRGLINPAAAALTATML